jgi:tRNA(adenine34) deaminase
LAEESFMSMAIEQAKAAAMRSEVPVGAVLVYQNQVIARAGNETRALNELSQERLIDCDLYVTLEPCAMCAGAISFARIRRLYIGAEDEKGGGVINGGRFFNQPTCHHAPDVYSGFQSDVCAQILKEFFNRQR